MAKKYYAVKNGKSGSGIFLTWETCKAQVEGIPGVKYKSFSSLEDAEAFLEGKEPVAKAKPQKREAPEPPFKEGAAIAYTDGSYHKGTKEFAAGAVVFYNGERIDFSQKNDDADLAEMHNVAGEIMAAVLVIRWCVSQHIPALEIYHDYRGVAKWATGEWKANKPGTQAYAAFCQKASKNIKLRFTEVQGHSGDYWNDEADRLAKQALGITS